MSKYNRIAEDKQQLQQFADKVSDNGWDKLGVLVLPVPSVEKTWAQYKERYGINLYDIFELDPSETYPVFKKSFSKILYIDMSEISNSEPLLPVVAKGYSSSDTLMLPVNEYNKDGTTTAYGFIEIDYGTSIKWVEP